jgi:hypothetical protein
MRIEGRRRNASGHETETSEEASERPRERAFFLPLRSAARWHYTHADDNAGEEREREREREREGETRNKMRLHYMHSRRLCFRAARASVDALPFCARNKSAEPVFRCTEAKAFYNGGEDARA